MRRSFKQVDILSSTRINESELLRAVNLEISVLKGLDIFTNAHVQGVVKTTMAMCKRMDMSYEEIKKCIISAYLHDVGKIRVPPEKSESTKRTQRTKHPL